MDTDSKLAALRKKWLETKDIGMRKIIERQAKLLKMSQEKPKTEPLDETIKWMFGIKETGGNS